MTSLRSSVNPDSSKQPWGTIIKPNFGMGYQKMNAYELDQTVERLSQPKDKRERVYDHPQMKNLDQAGYDQMMERLAEVNKEKITDSKRTQQHSIYKNMGVVNAFAWKGYN